MCDRYVDSLSLAKQLSIEERTFDDADSNGKKEVPGDITNSQSSSEGSGGVSTRGVSMWRQRMYDV